jgi:hypothetical protein
MQHASSKQLVNRHARDLPFPSVAFDFSNNLSAGGGWLIVAIQSSCHVVYLHIYTYEEGLTGYGPDNSSTGHSLSPCSMIEWIMDMGYSQLSAAGLAISNNPCFVLPRRIYLLHHLSLMSRYSYLGILLCSLFKQQGGGSLHLFTYISSEIIYETNSAVVVDFSCPYLPFFTIEFIF